LTVVALTVPFAEGLAGVRDARAGGAVVAMLRSTVNIAKIAI
jgi:hypothetical protein